MTVTELVKRSRSKHTIYTIVRFVGNDAGRFAELVKLLFNSPPKVVLIASWAMSNCAQNHPELLSKHFAELLKAATAPAVADIVKRSALRALQFAEIPRRYQGKTAQLCFEVLENKKEPVAIRVFAMSVLADLALKNPDMKGEVIALIEEGLPYAKPAYLSRARKTLNRLGKASLSKD